MTEIIFKSEIDNVKIDAFTDFGLALPQDYKFNREEANAR
jgi:hypothetical protein